MLEAKKREHNRTGGLQGDCSSSSSSSSSSNNSSSSSSAADQSDDGSTSSSRSRLSCDVPEAEAEGMDRSVGCTTAIPATHAHGAVMGMGDQGRRQQ